MSVAEGGERVQKWVLDHQPDRDDHDAGQVFIFTLPCAWLAGMPTPQAVLSMAARSASASWMEKEIQRLILVTFRFAATYAINTGFQFTVEVRTSKSFHPVCLEKPWGRFVNFAQEC